MSDSSVHRIIPEKPILLVSGCTFETIAGQFQQCTTDIVCVKNGVNLLIFKSGSEIPQYLKYESCKMVTQTRVMESYFRSTVDKSLYAFFFDDVKTWLRSGRPGGDLKLSGPAREITNTPSLSNSVPIPVQPRIVNPPPPLAPVIVQAPPKVVTQAPPNQHIKAPPQMVIDAASTEVSLAYLESEWTYSGQSDNINPQNIKVNPPPGIGKPPPKQQFLEMSEFDVDSDDDNAIVGLTLDVDLLSQPLSGTMEDLAFYRRDHHQ